jgi:hypothetical protein
VPAGPIPVGETTTLQFVVLDEFGWPVADTLEAVDYGAGAGLDLVAVRVVRAGLIAFDVTASRAGSYEFKIKPSSAYRGPETSVVVEFASATPPLNWFQQLIQKLIAFLLSLLTGWSID